MTHKKTAAAVSVILVIIFALIFVLLGFASVLDDNTDIRQYGVENLADTSNPPEDGQVSNQYTIANLPSGYMAVGGDSGRDISYVRSNPTGKYMLVGDITVSQLDLGTSFSGILDGNGYNIYINAENTGIGSDRVGGLFANLSGTVKNAKIVVDKFRAGTSNNDMTGGIVAGYAYEGAVVENCYIQLKYSPTSNANEENGGFCDFYLYQSSQRGKDSKIRLGGVIGITAGNTTIREVTVDNQTTGNYGFSIKGWREGGDFFIHSDGFHYLGGVIASADGGTVNLTNITLAGKSTSKFTVHNESTSSYRFNSGMLGGLVGYNNSGTLNIDGVILSYPIVVTSGAAGYNMVLSNMNYSEKTCAGVLIGWDDDGDASYSIKNVYFVDGAETDWITGKRNSYHGVIGFDSSMNPKFDGNNIYFYGATKVAPDSKDLVYQIQNGSKLQPVTDQLILKDGEVSGPAWVYGVKTGDTGVAGRVNLNYSKVTQGSIEFSTSMEVASQDDTYLIFEKVYDGNVIVAPLLNLKNGGSTVTVNNVYSEANPDRNVGEHILTYSKESIINAGFNTYTYNNKTVIGNAMTGIMYLPGNISIGGQSQGLDITKSLKVIINPLDIQVGFASTNFITYGDSLEAVKEKNQDVRIFSVNGVEGATAPDAILSWDIAGYEPYAQNVGALVALSVQNVVMANNSTNNYRITSVSKDTAIVARQIKGNISLADGVSLVYDGTPKTAKFTILSGAENDPEIGNRITFDLDGTDNVNVGTFTIRAVLPTVDGVANYAFSSDSITKAEYTITPKSVEISAKQAQNKLYDNTAFADFTSLFDIPMGVDGEPVEYDFAITKDNQAVSEIKEVGTYTITATLKEGQTNYTSNSASTQFEVNKAQIKGTIQMPEDMQYDGTAKIPQYIFDEGSALYIEGEEIIFEYSGSNVNAGTITITAKLPNSNYEFIVDGSVAETQTASMTIEKRQVNLSLQNIVKTYDGEIYDFSTIEVEGKEAFVDDVEISVSSPTAKADKGSYALQITTSLDANPNYNIVKDSDKSLTINAKPVSLTIENAVKTYDGQLFDFSGYAVSGMDGFLAKDNVSANVSAIDAKADKGVYNLVITTTADDNANYSITRSEDKTLTINSRSVTLSIENAQSVYNNQPYDFTDFAVEVGGEGFVAQDNVIISVSAEGNATDVGEYPLTITTTADDNANYSITRSEDKILTISPLEVNISAKEPQSKTFDGQAFEDFASLFNIPMGMDSLPLQYDFAITKGSESTDSVINAGEYTITATLKDGQSNYVSNSASVVFTVNVLNVELKAKQAEATSMYDGMEVTEEELLRYFDIPVDVQGQPLSVQLSISGAASTILNAGDYTVSISLADTSGNYSANTASITYKLMKQTVAIPVPETKEFVYNNSEHTLEITENSLYSIEGNKATDAGEYQAVVSLINTDNYQWSDGTTEPQLIAWTIKQADAVVNPQVEGKHFYDGHEMPAISLGENDTQGTIAWQEDILTFGINTYNWVFTPTDSKNYKSAKGTYTLEVEAIVLTSLKIEFNAGENKIYTSTPLDELKNYLVVTGINNDGSEYGIIGKEEYSLSGTLTAGTSIITMSYNDITSTFEVANVIGVVLERIEITALPHKSVYTVFEKLDITGLEITAYYTDGTEKIVTEDCVADVDTMAITTTKVVFSYTDATATKTAEFSVTVNSIKVAAPDVDELQQFVYNSEEQTFVIVDGENYSVSGNKATNAGEYNAVIALDDKTNYEWSTGGNADIEYAWSIDKMLIKGDIVFPESLVFDGKAKQAEFDITIGKLYGDDAIVVSYDGDTTNAGTVNVSVSLPSDNYEFHSSVVQSNEMVITPVEIELSFNSLTIVYNTPTEEFDINSIIATARGMASNQIQIGDNTYNYTTSVEYANPENTYKQGDEKDTTYELNVNLTIEGLDARNYTYDNKATLKVIATPLEGVLVAEASGIEYDGNTHGATLTETTANPEDYQIEYSVKGMNQWSTALPVNAGTYTVRVVATTDSYSGERIATIEIVILKKNVVITANQSEVQMAYKGEVSEAELESYFTAPVGVLEEGALPLAITVKGMGETVNGVGVYTLKAKLDAEATNYKADEVSIRYTVVPAEVVAPVPSQQKFTYTGSELTYDIPASAQYIISGNKATNAGNYTATVKLADKKNYVWADSKDITDKTFAWSIDKATPQITPQVEDTTYFDGHKMPQITTAEGSTAGNIVWTDSVLEFGKEMYSWLFTPSDTANYNTLEGTYNLTVVEIKIVSIEVELKDGANVYTSTPLDDIKALINIRATNNDGSVIEQLSPDKIRLQGDISEGAKIFTAYYLDDESITDDFAVTVLKVELASLEAIFEQGDAEIFPTNSLEDLKKYLTVNGINNDGTLYGEITEYELLGNLDRIKSVITVKYTGSDTSLEVSNTTFIVNVSTAALESIAVTKNPDYLAYTAYDVFDRQGMEVTAYYTDGTSQVIEDYEVVGGDSLQVKFSTEGIIIRYAEDDIVCETVLNGLEIIKRKVDVITPTAQTFVYNGKPQTFVFTPGKYYTIIDNVQTNAGYYIAYVVLNDKENCEWNYQSGEQDNTADIPIYWNIAKKPVSLTLKGDIVNQKIYDGVTITKEEFKNYFDLSININPDEENISEDDVDFEIMLSNDGEGICDAGRYTVLAKLTEGSSNFTANTPSFTYQIQRANKDMLADMSVGYKSITLSLTNGLDSALYSFDNKNWNKLQSLDISVDMSDKYVIYLRYEQSTNYWASDTLKIEKNITKDALLEYLKENFDDSFDKSDIVRFETFLSYAKSPDGENAQYDSLYAKMYADYEKVAGDLKQAISSALATGSQVAGYSSAMAVSLTLTSIGTGFALAAMSLSLGRKTNKSSKNKKMIIASLLVVIIMVGVVGAFAGCQKTEVDNMANVLDIIKSSNELKVDIIEGEESIYTYDNGAISSNKYNIVINVNGIIGNKGGDNISLTKDNLVAGYTIIIDESTGKATVKGKLQNTKISTINGAEVVIECNLKTKTTQKYEISYNDAWGYKVVINLVK